MPPLRRDRVGRLRSPNRFSLTSGVGAKFREDTDALASAEWIVAVDCGGDKTDKEVFAAARVSEGVVASLLPVREEEVTFLAPADGSVRRRRVRRLMGLVLSEEPLPPPPPEEAAAVITRALREDPASILSAQQLNTVVRLPLVFEP